MRTLHRNRKGERKGRRKEGEVQSRREGTKKGNDVREEGRMDE